MTNHREQQETEVSLKLSIVLSHTYKSVMEHSKKDIKQHGLNPTEFAVLELLYSKGPYPIQQICDKILLPIGSITYVVKNLERKGYLVRETSAKDQRVIYAKITPLGQRLFDQIFPQQVEAIMKAVKGLSLEEKEQAIKILKKLGIYAKKQL